MSLGRVALELHGVRLGLESELESFSDYVRVAMEPFVLADGGQAAQPAECDIHSRLSWRDGRPGTDLNRAFPGAVWERRPDRSLYIGGDAAYWLKIDAFRDLQMRFRLPAATPHRLELEGLYHFHLAGSGPSETVQRLRYRRRLDTLRARRFSTLLYYLVYHPLLWMLRRRQGWAVLHGGAVATPDGAVVLVGMPGCGKSTLLSAMLADARCALLSDNLLLYHAGRVRACPELMLLDDSSLQRAGEGARRLHGTGEQRVYERGAYRPDRYYLDAIAPAALFCVEHGRRTEVEPLDDGACVARIIGGNTMAREVRRIASNCEVLDQLAGTRASDPQPELERLVSSIPTAVLRIGQGDDLAQIVQRHVMPAVADGASGRVA